MFQNPYIHCLIIITLIGNVWARHHHNNKHSHEKENGLSLWIDEKQVRIFSGFDMKIFAIDDGRVSPHIKDPNFNQYLPLIPSEVSCVNFTWKSGKKKYHYSFDRLQSLDEDILKPPTISIKLQGKVPSEPTQFSVVLPCLENKSGIAMFRIELLIHNRKGKPLPGTPLRLSLKKECAHRGVYDRTTLESSPAPDPECDIKCANNGWCNQEKKCQCSEGYMGQYCQTALCFPQCMNGGNCTAPAVCSCPKGFQGRHCEGGICAEKCLNGGKCVQKDKCKCSKGYYGIRCEYSKCYIPCLNGGRCKGSNKCRCPPGWLGDHCHIPGGQRPTCKKPCKNGICMPTHTCKCDPGWSGRFCNQKNNRKRNRPQRTPDPECDIKCANNGWCNQEKKCQCSEGYMGQYCQTALCYPQCMNGGNCTAPAVCSCPKGFQGRHCEGGICAEKCLNGGKCIQKDKCECTNGYYGIRCEFSKCQMVCSNGGKCNGSNKCRCPPGWLGDHCHIPGGQRSTCIKRCKNGSCMPTHTCKCDPGWFGPFCNQKNNRKRNRAQQNN